MKQQNPYAKALQNPLFRKRIVKSKKVYNRNKEKGIR
jgi:stalled ribosome alternative rescue factor ArfA